MSAPFEDSGERGGGYKRCRCGWWEPEISASCGNAAHDGNVRSLAVEIATARRAPVPALDSHLTSSAVDHPVHYNASPAKCSKCGHPIECIDVVRHMNFNVGNVVKYLWRAGLKGELLEDVKKALWYLTDELARIERGGGKP